MKCFSRFWVWLRESKDSIKSLYLLLAIIGSCIVFMVAHCGPRVNPTVPPDQSGITTNTVDRLDLLAKDPKVEKLIEYFQKNERPVGFSGQRFELYSVLKIAKEAKMDVDERVIREVLLQMADANVVHVETNSKSKVEFFFLNYSGNFQILTNRIAHRKSTTSD